MKIFFFFLVLKIRGSEEVLYWGGKSKSGEILNVEVFVMQMDSMGGS